MNLNIPLIVVYLSLILISITWIILINYLVKSRSNKYLAKMSGGRIKLDDWARLATGESGNIDLEKYWLRITQEIYGVFCRKQHDYGPNNIALGGVRGVILRTSDKIARLWELTGLKGLLDGGNVSDKESTAGESLEDSLIDVADYGIIALMVSRGHWPVLDVSNAFGGNAFVKVLFELMDRDESLYDQLIVYTVSKQIAKDLGGRLEY